jgi:hypothetical protein
MLTAIDIHKAVFQAAVLDPAGGEITEERFKASRDALAIWAERWVGKLEAVAIEATTGWRWVARELQSRGHRGALDRRRSGKRVAGQPQTPKERPFGRPVVGDADGARDVAGGVAGA